MSTKLIGALMILVLVWGGYRIFTYYKEVQEQRWIEKDKASGKNIDEAKLAGMPYQLERSLEQAQSGGTETMREWLERYGEQIRDPRKAWIQLDYCTMIARDDPQEAKAVYRAVKERLQEESPVYPRLKQFEKSFE
jgi:hypothetical protein